MTPTPDIDALVAELRVRAENATGGPWHMAGNDCVAYEHAVQRCCGRGGDECCGDPVIDVESGELCHCGANDAPYLAMCSPSNLTAILDDRDQLVAENAELKATLTKRNDQHQEFVDQAREWLEGRETLRARLAEAERVMRRAKQCAEVMAQVYRDSQSSEVADAIDAFLANAPADKPEGNAQ